MNIILFVYVQHALHRRAYRRLEEANEKGNREEGSRKREQECRRTEEAEENRIVHRQSEEEDFPAVSPIREEQANSGVKRTQTRIPQPHSRPNRKGESPKAKTQHHPPTAARNNQERDRYRTHKVEREAKGGEKSDCTLEQVLILPDKGRREEDRGGSEEVPGGSAGREGGEAEAGE